MIKFTTVRFKNFIGTGNVFTEIPLDQHHMTLIIGENGAGKSQLLDAICFALFGKPFRKINKPSVVNTINNKNCVVEIEFATNGHSYKVIRGLKPVVFEIWRDDHLIKQEAANKDYQEYLEKTILKTNYRSFTQIVLLGSAVYTPFMQLSASERREVIDDLLDIEIFTRMNALAKSRLSQNKSDTAVNNRLIESQRLRIEQIKTAINSLKTNNEIYKQNRLSEIRDFENQLEIAKNEKMQLEREKQNFEINDGFFEELKTKERELLQLNSTFNNKIKESQSRHAFYMEHDNCDACKQSIDHDFKQKMISDIQEKIEQFKNARTQIHGDVETIRKNIEAEQNKINAYHELDGKIGQLNSQIDMLEWKIRNLNDSMKDEYDEKAMAEQLKWLSEAETELSVLMDEKQKLADDRDILEIGAGILKDGGIKAQIIKRFLPVINQSINFFLKKMDFMVEFRLDENFNETIMSRYRDEFQYNNFSEGEKSRIDLAVMLAFRQVAKSRNSLSTNILVFDEVLDGSLDVSGKNGLMMHFKKWLTDHNIFIISHSEGMKDYFNHVYTVKKQRNFSVYQ